MAGFGVALRAGPAVADWLRESRRRLAALFDDEKKQNGRIQNVSYRVSFVVSAIGWHLFFCKPNFSLKLISCNGTCYRIKYLSLLFGGTYLPSFTEFLFTCMRVGWFHSVVFSFLFWVHQIGGRKLRIWNRRPTMIGQWEAFPFFFCYLFIFCFPIGPPFGFYPHFTFPFFEGIFFFFSFLFLFFLGVFKKWKLSNAVLSCKITSRWLNVSLDFQFCRQIVLFCCLGVRLGLVSLRLG